MELPTNFETAPGKEPHRAFRNTCIEFRKVIKSSKDIKQLQQEMEKFIDESKQMNWNIKNTGVYHKDEGTKLVDKVCTEFGRYIADLEPYLNRANSADLLNALQQLEKFVDDYKVY